jgi:hypothetical protein
VRERSILVRELDALPGVVRALIAVLMPDAAKSAAASSSATPPL